MESRKLMSHSDYEDSIDLPTVSDIEFRIKSRNHRKFINEKLTLGMFVPTDEDGNILEEPEYYELWKSFGSYTQKGESIVVECRKYHEALSNVIFEGFDSYKLDNIENNYRIFNGSICVWTTISSNNKTIEDLIKYGVKITPSAITKYQI